MWIGPSQAAPLPGPLPTPSSWGEGITCLQWWWHQDASASSCLHVLPQPNTIPQIEFGRPSRWLWTSARFSSQCEPQISNLRQSRRHEIMNGSTPPGLWGVDRTSAAKRAGCVAGAVPSPSPQPSPLGRGGSRSSALTGRTALSSRTAWRQISLSPRERVGVRGNWTLLNPTCQAAPGTVQLWESRRQSRRFP